MTLGIVVLFIGIILFPFAIISLKEEHEEFKELPFTRKLVIYAFSIFDLFSGNSPLPWLFGASILLIIGGLILMYV